MGQLLGEMEGFLIGAILACFYADRYDPAEREKNDEVEE